MWKRYLDGEETFGRQAVFSAAVGEAVVLGLQDGEAAGHKQPAVEELEGGAAARRLAGVHAHIVQDVAEHGAQLPQELPGRPLVKYLLQTKHVYIGREERGHLPRHAVLLVQALGQQSPRGTAVAAGALLVGVLVGVAGGGLLVRHFGLVLAGNAHRLGGGMLSLRRGRRLPVSGPVRGRVPTGQDAVGRGQGAAAAGGVDKDSDVRPADSLSDAAADGRRPALRVAQVVEASQAVGQQAQVGRGETKRRLPRLLEPPVDLPLRGARLLHVVVEGPAARLQGGPQQEAQQGYGRRGEEEEEEGEGAKEDFERVEVTLLVRPLTSLQGGGLAHSNETVQGPEAGQDERPAHAVEERHKAIGEGRGLQDHVSGAPPLHHSPSKPGGSAPPLPVSRASPC